MDDTDKNKAHARPFRPIVKDFAWVKTTADDWELVNISHILRVRPQDPRRPGNSVFVLNTTLDGEAVIPSVWTVEEAAQNLLYFQQASRSIY